IEGSTILPYCLTPYNEWKFGERRWIDWPVYRHANIVELGIAELERLGRCARADDKVGRVQLMAMPIDCCNFGIFRQRMKPQAFDRIRPGIWRQSPTLKRGYEARELGIRRLGSGRSLLNAREWVWIGIESAAAGREQIDRARHAILAGVAAVGIIHARV